MHGATADEKAISEAQRHARAIKSMSYRTAKEMYHIGYNTWRGIKNGQLDAWVPATGGRSLAQDAIDSILHSVKATPELNTRARAAAVGIRTETVQRVLARHGLNRLTDRLRYAGFAVDVVQPLAAARKRRLLAAYPGALTNIDFKAFGVVRGSTGTASVKVCGCVVVDHLTSWATVFLHPEESSDAAVLALDKHFRGFPCKGRGILLSDNGLAFTSDAYLAACARHTLMPRTTRYNHPWSNGKVEALNKTLKQSCFPAICSGVVRDLAALQELVDVWMQDYNHRRAHSGWINRGLPPAVFLDRWQSAKGTPVERMEALGLVKPADIPYIRIMGTNRTGVAALAAGLHDEQGVPFVFIIDHNMRDEPERGRRSRFVPFRPDAQKNVTLAR